MKLYDESWVKDMPKIGETEGQGDNAVVRLKLFDPCGRYTGYFTEFDGEDQLFGYVVSPLGPDCDEWGYSSLAELQAARGRLGLGIERDLYFKPCTVGHLKKEGWNR